MYDLNFASARVAREAADAWTAKTPDQPRFVAGSVGPTNRTASISPDVNDPGYRAVTFQDLVTAYKGQMVALIDGGVDALLIETVFDTLNAKAALFAAEEAFDQTGQRLPIMVSGTITDASGRTLSRANCRGLLGLHEPCASVLHWPELRPRRDQMHPPPRSPFQCRHVQHLRAPQRGTAQRNGRVRAGTGGHETSPGSFCGQGACQRPRRLLRHHSGPHPGHRRTRQRPFSPTRCPIRSHRGMTARPLLSLSGLEPLWVTPDTNFVNVGERTNVTGSRFLRLIKEDRFEEAIEVAREQVEGGAQILDVNMDEGLLDRRAA